MRTPLLILTAASLLLPRAASPADGDLWPDREAIEHFLKKADVTERVEIGSGVTRPQRLTLELDGVVRHACFKKIDVKEQDSWRYEVAAYELDKLLDLGMVPPTVKRVVGGREGDVQLWVAGVTMEDYESDFPDIEAWRDQVSVMWLFDDLIGNCDRHLNNAIVSPEHRLILIDNSKTFRYEKRLRNDLNACQTGTDARFWGVEFDATRERYPTRYPPDLVERLRSLTDEQIKNAIKKHVWGSPQRLVLRRREMILERLEAMGHAVFRPPSLLEVSRPARVSGVAAGPD
jgi:hypothetical protein